jgi:HK97 family phage portal protein
MSVLDAIMRPFGLLPGIRAEGSTLGNPSRWLIDWVRGEAGDSGVRIDGETALTYSTIWQAVNVLAGDVGQLPLDIYTRTGPDGEDRKIDRAHPAQKVIRHLPNPYTSAQDFWETLMLYALLWGNGVAEIKRDGRGDPMELTPLLPDRTQMEVVDGRPWIVTRIGKNREDLTNFRKIPYQDVFHLRGLSSDGLWGISVIRKARNSWALGLGQEKYAGKYFANGALPGGVLEHPHRIGDEDDVRRIREDWSAIHAGLDNVSRIAVLEEGMTFKPMSFTNRDSQWLEGRRFQKSEIASWFNLPPHKVGDLERETHKNIEEQNRSYLGMSLMRHLLKISAEGRQKLLRGSERDNDTHFLEHNTAALLRGDLASRYQAYAVGINNRFLCPNEVRRRENLPPYEGGDEFLVPLNIGQGGEDNMSDDPEATGSRGGGGTAQDAAKETFRKQMAYLSDVEAKRIRQEARDPRRITGWMEKFYGSQWPAKLREGLVPWGQADLADVWCRRSLEILDQVVGTATDKELEQAIETALKEWPSRVDALVKEVFG